MDSGTSNKYVICLFGDATKFSDFEEKFAEFCQLHGIDKELIHIFDGATPNNSKTKCQENEVIGVYLSDGQPPCIPDTTDKALTLLNRHGCFIFPVVRDLKNARNELGNETLSKYNACAYERQEGKELLPTALFSHIIAAFHLSPLHRKVFISYSRDAALEIAQQLRDALVLRGYSVFLDTTSISYGVVFQRELMNRLNDADIMLLLHSNNVSGSEWITREIVAAEVRGVSLIDVRWPNLKKDNILLPFATEVQLSKGDICHKRITGKACVSLCEAVENNRIRSLVLRREALLHSWKKNHASEEDVIYEQRAYDNAHILHIKNAASEREVMLCPHIPDSSVLYRYVCDGKNILKTAFCRLGGYSDEYRNYITWLCNKTGVKLLKQESSETPTLRIFLSASCPAGERAKIYAAKPTVVQRAVISLVSVFIPHSKIVFGGHPFISPFVLEIAEQYSIASSNSENKITIFQSEFFSKDAPKEIKNLINQNCIKWTEIKTDENGKPDREASLSHMREKMIFGEYDAAFFIGGMNGVEIEYGMFQDLYPQVPAFVLPSTGGAAQEIYNQEEYSWPDQFPSIKPDEYHFVHIFSEILNRLLPSQTEHK